MEMFMFLFIGAGLLYLVRGLAGPSFADRYLGINTIISIIALFMVIESIRIGQQFYLDLAILFVMLSFVGSLAIAKYAKGVENDK